MAIYLDHNASTPLDERVFEAMLPFLKVDYGNASSVHQRGRIARHAIEAAREQVASLVNVHPSQLVFTSGGTEANNQALNVVRSRATQGQLVVGATEHASVLDVAKHMTQCGYELKTCDVDAQGLIIKECFVELMAAQPLLASIMVANNETGTLQSIADLSSVARDAGVVFHTDAVQALGKMTVDFPATGAHLMSLSAHKLYGPKGVGALIVEPNFDLSPLLVGGGQEKGRRSGTENVAAIVGFGVAAQLAEQEQQARALHLQTLRDYLEQRLRALPEISIFAQAAARLPNTVFMAVPGFDGETLLMELDRAGMEVSSGSACDSEKTGASHVLLAMGVEPEQARCAIRISFGKDNTVADVDAFLDALQQQIHTLRTQSSLAWA